MTKKKIKRPKSRSRLWNPFDGSLKRSQEEHKSKKKYNRKSKYKLI